MNLKICLEYYYYYILFYLQFDELYYFLGL
jgi:hypothetical protein